MWLSNILGKDITKSNMTEQQCNKIIKNLGLVPVTIDSKGEQLYTMDRKLYHAKFDDNELGWYKDKLFYIDLTFALDKFGVVRTCNQNYNNSLLTKHANLDKCKNTKAIIPISRYSLVKELSYPKVRFKTNSKGEIVLSAMKEELVRMYEEPAYISFLNNLAKPIKVMKEVYRDGKATEISYEVKPGETTLVSIRAYTDMISGKLEKASQSDKELKQLENLHSLDTVEIAPLRLDNLQFIANNCGHLLKRLIINNKVQDTDSEYEIIRVVVNNNNEAIGYDVVGYNFLGEARKSSRLGKGTVESLAGKGKIKNATLVNEEGKKPFLRGTNGCKLNELPRIECMY